MHSRTSAPTLFISAAILFSATLLTGAFPVPAAAQSRPILSNVIPTDAAVTIHAKIKAIDLAKRQVTLEGRSGAPVSVLVGPDVRLDMLKVGDTVDAQYYRSVAFVISPPGGMAPEDDITQAIARPAEGPGGFGMQVTRVSGLVVGIDINAHSLDLVNPQGGEVYTVNVTDPARQAKLPLLKVGDTISAAVTEAIAVSIKPAPKSWF